MKALQVKNINKHFYKPTPFHVLKDINFEIEKGEFVAIVGKSGSGKSTLLYLLSTMDSNYQGSIALNGTKITGLTKRELASFRNQHIGFVFQFHYLLTEFSVLDNIMLPALKLNVKSKSEIKREAMELIEILNITGQEHKKASDISGGQQQRVAVARALINSPAIVMGDEPTGNLDSTNTENIFKLFKRLAEERKQTIIAVTHDNDFAANCDRIIELKDGTLL
jgi:lipoprotein-releasing system ATP-binding protein